MAFSQIADFSCENRQKSSKSFQDLLQSCDKYKESPTMHTTKR